MEFEMIIDSCMVNVLNHEWKVYRDSCGPILGEEETLPNNVTTTTPSLVIPARTLRYGQHCVVFTSQFNMVDTYSKVHIDLSIMFSALVAIIEGGSTRTMARADTIILDGSQSFDPDRQREEDQMLEYTWLCSARVSWQIKHD